MPSTAACIAVDWGTTNRRGTLTGDDGAVLDGCGVLSLMPECYPAEVAAGRQRPGVRPVIAAGVIGGGLLVQLHAAAIGEAAAEVAILDGARPCAAGIHLL